MDIMNIYLPMELHKLIMLECNIKSLINLSSVCKLYSQVVLNIVETYPIAMTIITYYYQPGTIHSSISLFGILDSGSSNFMSKTYNYYMITIKEYLNEIHLKELLFERNQINQRAFYQPFISENKIESLVSQMGSGIRAKYKALFSKPKIVISDNRINHKDNDFINRNYQIFIFNREGLFYTGSLSNDYRIFSEEMIEMIKMANDSDDPLDF